MRNLLILLTLTLGCSNGQSFSASTTASKYKQITYPRTVVTGAQPFEGDTSPDGHMLNKVLYEKIIKQLDPNGIRMKIVINEGTLQETTTTIIGNKMSVKGANGAIISPPTDLPDAVVAYISAWDVKETETDTGLRARSNHIISRSFNNQNSDTTYNERGLPSKIVVKGRSAVKRSIDDPGREDITQATISYDDVAGTDITYVDEVTLTLHEEEAGTKKQLLEQTTTVDKTGIVFTEEADAITF